MQDCKDAQDPASTLGSHWVPVHASPWEHAEQEQGIAMESVSDAYLGSSTTPNQDLTNWMRREESDPLPPG